jgi:phosphoribosylformimino-5-aminoimidazole carboxamide ribonucleotide (ProFAR) isomerase
MAKFIVTSPEGNDYHMNGPEGSTLEDAVNEAKRLYSKPALQAHATAMANKHGVPPEYLHSLIKHESNWDTHAISEDGAHGLTQLMKPTAEEVGVDRTDPYENIEGGAKYLAKQFKRFQSPELALAAYHSGPDRVTKANGIPAGKRVNKYVPDVMKHAQYLRMNPKDMGDGVVEPEQESAESPVATPVQQQPQNVWGITPEMLGADRKGRFGRLALGAASLPLGAAQLAANVVAPDTAGKYMNEQLSAIEKMKGQEGFDWAGLLGGVGGGIGVLKKIAPKVLRTVAPTLLGKMGQGAVLGAGGAAATPVTTGGDDFSGDKISQVALGTGLGGILPGLFTAGGDISNTIANFGKSFTKKGQDVIAGRNLAAAIDPKNVTQAQAMLRQYQPVVRGSNATVGEILSPLNRPEVSGMEKVVSAFNPAAYAKEKLKKGSAQYAQLAKIAGGQSPEASQEAVQAAKKQLSATVGGKMSGILDDANVGRSLDTSKLSNFIQSKIAEPGTRVSGIQKDALVHVTNKIKDAVEYGGGIVNAKDLHEIRKNAVNEKVTQLIGTSDPKASAKMAAQILSDIKPHIDDAIESAGGKGWKDALQDYERGMHNINRQKMAGKAQELLTKTPSRLVSLGQGNEPKMVEKIFGPGRVNLSTQMGDLTGGITQVADELAATQANKELANQGLQWANKRLGTMIPEIPPTGIFDPRLSMMRGVINRAAGRADNAIIENLAKTMANNPKEAARLLDMYQLSPAQKSQLFNFMLNNKAMRMAPGIISGQAVNQ